jgi:hypothetical protein
MQSDMPWNPLVAIRKLLSRRPPHGNGDKPLSDPESNAAFEASFARNREALEELAKL